MNLSINFSGITNINPVQNRKNVSFYGKTNQCDTFEKRKDDTISLEQVDTFEKCSKNADNTTIKDVKKAPELVRRENMTVDEIAKEFGNSYFKVFDKLGVPAQYRPACNVVEILPEGMGGGYYSQFHTILIGAKEFRLGRMEAPKIMAHEATHCDEAIKRASLSDEKVNKLVKDELISKITKVESSKVPIGCTPLGWVLLNCPKIPENMKTDFIKFAKENLYNDRELPPMLGIYIVTQELENYGNPKMRPTMDEIMIKRLELGCTPEEKDYIEALQKLTPAECKIEAQKGKNEALESDELKPFVDKLKTLLKNHPKFVQQYESEEKALDMLMLYSISHISRYKTLIQGAFPLVNGERLQIPQSEGEDRINAEESLSNFIKVAEDTLFIGDKDVSDLDKRQNDYYQYIFSPEEVKADINGSNFLIEEYSEKISDDTLSQEDKEFFTSKIEEAKKNIEYRTKGVKYLAKCEELKKSPDDEKLKSETEQLLKELKELEEYLPVYKIK